MEVRNFKIKPHKMLPQYAAQLPLDLDSLRNEIDIDISNCTDDICNFETLGVDVPIANAMRRIMLVEIPTMAITQVHIDTNNSKMEDDMLASRLGLLPIVADPKLFEFKKTEKENEIIDASPEDTIKFELKIANHSTTNVLTVKSKHIKWIPLKNQKEIHGEIKFVSTEIIINKLNPGKSLDITMYATKGIGKDHAKFSPVCTAFYRMLSKISLTKDFMDEEAKTLKAAFPEGVIEIVETPEGNEVASVKDVTLDYCSRNFMAHPELEKNVEMELISNNLVFEVETNGSITAADIVRQSIQILREKCQRYSSNLLKY